MNIPLGIAPGWFSSVELGSPPMVIRYGGHTPTMVIRYMEDIHPKQAHKAWRCDSLGSPILTFDAVGDDISYMDYMMSYIF